MESHQAVPEEHGAGDALIDVDHEHRSVGQRELEIFDRNLEIARRELLGRVHRQAIQAFDRRHLLLVRNRPFAIAAGVADALHVDRPRGNSGALTVLDERVDEQRVAVVGQSARQRLAIAFLDHGAGGAWHEFGAAEVARARPIRGVGQQRQVGGGVAGLHDLFETAQQHGHAVALRGLIVGADTLTGRCRQRQQRQYRHDDANLVHRFASTY